VILFFLITILRENILFYTNTGRRKYRWNFVTAVACTLWPSWTFCERYSWQQATHSCSWSVSGPLIGSARRVDYSGFEVLCTANRPNACHTKEPIVNCGLLPWYFDMLLMRRKQGNL